MALLEAKDIWKTYKVGKTNLDVLKGVSLEIEEGEFISIFGPSGSGKSTLMHILGCLDRPTKGEVLLNGEHVFNYGDEKLSEIRNKYMGFVFQNFFLIKSLSALENVALPGIFCNNHKRFERAKELLEMLGLGHRLHHRPNELSGGQMQRVQF